MLPFCSNSVITTLHSVFCLTDWNHSRQTAHIGRTIDKRNPRYVTVSSQRDHGPLSPFFKICFAAALVRSQIIVRHSLLHMTVHNKKGPRHQRVRSTRCITFVGTEDWKEPFSSKMFSSEKFTGLNASSVLRCEIQACFAYRSWAI